MNWSTEQLAIFTHFSSKPGRNLTVTARAGTGKTTTIKEAFNHAPESRMLYCVFNKKNQKEAEAKIKNDRVEVRTLHSLGYTYLKRQWPRCKPDPDLEWDRLDSIVDLRKRPEVRSAIIKLVGLAKNTLLTPTIELLQDLAAKNDIGFWDTAVNGWMVTMQILEMSKLKDKEGRISFDDMVWLPVVLGIVRPRYDLVVVDEAQDMNLPQLSMAKQACIQGGRVIVVGDDRQAIYGFRGAAQDGIGMMKVTLRADSLGLTTTYRCPKKVVEVAQKIVKDYHAAATAPDGEVINITETKAIGMAKPGDAFLSRLNAPLMPLALGFIRNRIPARIEGKDIGKQILGMIDSLKASDVKNFLDRVSEWEAKQVDRLQNAKYAEKRIEQVRDMAQTLYALAESADDMAGIKSAVNNLFQDTDENSRPAVILSSVHKAKGLEWPRVFVLSETFRLGKGTEEDNIYYVAVTRAMSALYLVSGRKEATPEAQLMPTEAPTKPAEPINQALTHREPPVPGPEKLDPSSLPAGAEFFRRGDVKVYQRAEWLCLRVGNCNAKFTCLSEAAFDEKEFSQTKWSEEAGEHVEVKVKKKFKRETKELAFSNSYFPNDPDSRPLRRMTEDQILEFLKGGTRAIQKQLPGEKQQTERTTDSMANKASKSNKGVSTYVRQLVADGLTKTQIHEKVAAKYANFQGEKNKDWFNAMIVIGERMAKAAKVAAKAGTKVTAKKASAKTLPPRKGKSKPPGRKATTAKSSSTPPPRPPAAPQAPATPPPVETPAPATKPEPVAA